MPRNPRIEYTGAVYHIMARGDRREPIVFSDEDRNLFIDTLGEVCGQTGWEVFAWVLMENHYHLAVRTPEANLVKGMTWFQNAFTRRINTRNQLWGHLFGGRYKAILVEDESNSESGLWRNYLTTLIDYIHLNPARAGLVDGTETSLLEYPWSSLASAYGVGPSKRAKWVVVKEGIDLLGEKDTVAGRRRLIQRMDEWAASEARERAGLVEFEGQSLQSTLRRGWYWGTQEFRERMVERFGKVTQGTKDRGVRGSELYQRHDKVGAERILRQGEKHFGAKLEVLSEPRYGDLRRVALAYALVKRTTVSRSWIAERLNLKSAANVSQRVKKFEQEKAGRLGELERKWRSKIQDLSHDP